MCAPDTVNCPACGFPNMPGVRACISCQSPLPQPQLPVEETGVSPRLQPSSNVQPSPSRPNPLPVSLDDSPQSPSEIIERLRQVRGEDFLRSLEMMAAPDNKTKLDGELDNTYAAAVRASASSENVEVLTAQTSPRQAQSYLPPNPDPWMVDHHELKAVEAPDPWRVRLPQYVGSSGSTTKPSLRNGYTPIDLISGVGILALLASIAMPWISVHGTTEGQALGPGSLPISLLVTGVSGSYPLPWLTAASVLAVLALISVVGLAVPRSQLAATGLTIAGLLAILTPAAFLVKLALSGETGATGEIAYVPDPGMYVALGGALVVLLGAALRNAGAPAHRH